MIGAKLGVKSALFGLAMGMIGLSGAASANSDAEVMSQYQQMMAQQEQDTIMLGGPSQPQAQPQYAPQPYQSQQYQQPAYQAPQQPAYQGYQYPAYQAPQQPAYQQPQYQQQPYQQNYQQPQYQQQAAAPQPYGQPQGQPVAQEPMVNDLEENGLGMGEERGILAIAGGSTLGLILLGVLLAL